MLWPLLEVVDEHLDEPWLRILAAHLDDSLNAERPRRLAAVRHLATLYDRYSLYRPEMLRAWEQGGGDWQAELWRRLRERIGQPGPAERTDAACQRIADEPGLLDLPPRLSLFGLTRLPARYLQVLRALAAAHEVHLFLLHPSHALWESGQDPRNRLLASWGTDAHEIQAVIEASGPYEDCPAPTPPEAATLLAQIQADVRADRVPVTGAFDDDSLQIHSCHGRARQVEVLRDAILHLLRDDPTLEPRDIVVMCPDIEAFAPLIHATFGAGDTDDDEQELRVRLADRSLRQTNPVLGTVSRILELADQRLTASQVLDLADRQAVRQRFGFDDKKVTRIQDWLADSGVRWGLDANHREPFQLGKQHANTWRAGLDRVLLGVTMTEDEHRLLAGVLPLDDVESDAVDLVGRFAELVDRLAAIVDDFAQPKRVTEWATAIAKAADALTATTTQDAWQRAELDRILTDVTHDAGESDATIDLAEARELLAERLQGRPTRTNFRTGHLTVCTLVPMRSVPHRVVCLLGLDDGVFPRKAPHDGDDLLLQDRRVGDHDSRAEDHQLLLDALLAATDRLIVTYSGHDERTNAERPPAVPVGQLLDIVERTAPDARHQIVAEHPLQPFDPKNFASTDPWSFDEVTLDGAKALTTGQRTKRPPFLSGPLPRPDTQILELDDLVKFVRHPVRAFLRQRLGISLSDFSEEISDAIPIELDQLETWGIGERLLAARLTGTPLDDALAAERSRGDVPPGVLADKVLAEVSRNVEAVLAAVDIPREPASLDVKLTLDDGRTLTGTVPDLYADTIKTVSYSRLGARHRLEAWVRLLALNAAHPQREFSATTIGRSQRRGRTVDVARIEPLTADDARATLARLIDLYDRGMREPAPLAAKTSAAYAQATHDNRNAEIQADREWTSKPSSFDKEDRDLEHQLVYGAIKPLKELLADPRFAQWSTQLWSDLLKHEEITTS